MAQCESTSLQCLIWEEENKLSSFEQTYKDHGRVTYPL